jgi:hypothetical protein
MSLRNVLLCLMATLFAAPLSLVADDTAKEGTTMVYELRTYTANPGKLADLHKRFRDHTMQLFEKHGMKNVGYWVPLDKPDTLVYLIAHKSREAANESWKAFMADPEWQAVYKESHKNGVLVKHVDRQYLTPTDYSPIK